MVSSRLSVWYHRKLTLLTISRLWRDAGFRNCRINFVRKYRNGTLYMVCVSAPWFITIKNDALVHAQTFRLQKASYILQSYGMHFSYRYWPLFLCWMSNFSSQCATGSQIRLLASGLYLGLYIFISNKRAVTVTGELGTGLLVYTLVSAGVLVAA